MYARNPKWVEDDSIWRDAVYEAEKKYRDLKRDDPSRFYAIVTSIYKQMGGRIKGRRNPVKVTPETTVYVRTLWFRDSDPFWSVITLDQEEADTIADEHVDEVLEYDEDAEEEDIMTSYGPPVAFALSELVSEREMDEAIRDLEDFGYYYPEL